MDCVVVCIILVKVIVTVSAGDWGGGVGVAVLDNKVRMAEMRYADP